MADNCNYLLTQAKLSEVQMEWTFHEASSLVWDPKNDEAMGTFCLLCVQNLVLPVLELIGKFAGLPVSAGMNALSGNGETSHQNILLLRDVLLREIVLASHGWDCITGPLSPLSLNQELVCAMLWDGWLRVPTQKLDRKVFMTVPFRTCRLRAEVPAHQNTKVHTGDDDE